jgi:hypothetical protein
MIILSFLAGKSKLLLLWKYCTYTNVRLLLTTERCIEHQCIYLLYADITFV